MRKIEWCCNQKRGISLVEPNGTIASDYMEKANSNLESMQSVTSSDWKVIIGYYACYNALYARLIEKGIKSEIHDCTIELMKHIPSFTQEEIAFLDSLKNDRIDVQYYLKKREVDQQKVKEFILKCNHGSLT
jgi:uncharacterized protein (UPF0332 family)